MKRPAKRCLGLLLFLAAGLAAPARPADAWWAWFAPPPAPINSPAFAVRAPPPGRPGYLETIGYIDNGLQYVDPNSGFFVAADGRMCFIGVLDAGRTTFESWQDPWCVAPKALADVEVIENDVTYVPQLRLWCRHAAPQCFQETSQPYRASGSIAVAIIPSRREKAAVEYLIYLMGGRVPADRPQRD